MYMYKFKYINNKHNKYTCIFIPYKYQFGIIYSIYLHRNNILLLLLSYFSRVRLCVTPQTAANQAPPSLGFSRQEHWGGLPFPSPMHESEINVFI